MIQAGDYAEIFMATKSSISQPASSLASLLLPTHLPNLVHEATLRWGGIFYQKMPWVFIHIFIMQKNIKIVGWLYVIFFCTQVNEDQCFDCLFSASVHHLENSRLDIIAALKSLTFYILLSSTLHISLMNCLFLVLIKDFAFVCWRAPPFCWIKLKFYIKLLEDFAQIGLIVPIY